MRRELTWAEDGGPSVDLYFGRRPHEATSGLQAEQTSGVSASHRHVVSSSRDTSQYFGVFPTVYGVEYHGSLSLTGEYINHWS